MQKSKRGTPRRRKRKPARKSTALARRRDAVPSRFFSMPAAVQPLAPMTLTREPIMVATFVGTLKLSKEQIDALRRPVEDKEIEWRSAQKDGPKIIPYLSHNGYRDRLDAAFGLGGWGMVPVGMPVEKSDAIYTPYALVIDGVPRIYAWGEQQLHKMTFGDGLEGAKSNAITRCGKELGIARELWNRGHVEQLLRLKGTAPADGSTRASSPAATESYNARELEPITQPQRRRLWTIAKHVGRSDAEISIWLKAVYNLDDTKSIARKDYDAICSALERPGALPMPEES